MAEHPSLYNLLSALFPDSQKTHGWLNCPPVTRPNPDLSSFAWIYWQSPIGTLQLPMLYLMNELLRLESFVSLKQARHRDKQILFSWLDLPWLQNNCSCRSPRLQLAYSFQQNSRENHPAKTLWSWELGPYCNSLKKNNLNHWCISVFNIFLKYSFSSELQWKLCSGFISAIS